MSPNPNGQRLLVLRELEGITQGQLAERLGVSQSTVSYVEKAERALTDEWIKRACAEFEIPPSFFSVAPSVLDVSLPTFRKSSRAGAADERRVVRRYREAARCFANASHASGYHEVAIPAGLEDAGVEEAAAEIRSLAGVGRDEPIKNVTRMLERLGFGVITQLDAHSDQAEAKHSGISVPSIESRRPLIALVAAMPGAVMRFTLAHELAHHIFDGKAGGTWRSTRSPEEKRAHAFAGALLLPRSAVETHITEDLHLSGYLTLKSRYGVSVGASIMRAEQLGRISTDRARSLHIQLSARGWRRSEPVEVAVERPLLFAQALAKISDMSRRSVEELTGLPTEMVFGWLNLEPPPPDNVVDLQSWVRDRRVTST